MSGAIVFDKIVKEDMHIGVGNVEVPNPGGGTLIGRKVNLSSFAHALYSAAFAPPSINPGQTTGIDITVPGASLGDFVLASFDGAGFFGDPALMIHGKVIAADQVHVHIVNTGEIAVNPGSGTLRVMIFKTDH